MPQRCLQICSLVLSVFAKVKFHVFVFVPADTSFFFMFAVTTKSMLSSCFCCLVKCYFSVVVTVPLKVFTNLFPSLISGHKSTISTFFVCLADTGMIFIVAVTTKSTQSFFFVVS